jgi:DNA (cytosine-5)-methyltransferase 1
MKVVGLFSGAGGLDLGFKKAGCELIWANDIEPRFTETYKKNVSSKIITKDIKNVVTEENCMNLLVFLHQILPIF